MSTGANPRSDEYPRFRLLSECWVWCSTRTCASTIYGIALSYCRFTINRFRPALPKGCQRPEHTSSSPPSHLTRLIVAPFSLQLQLLSRPIDHKQVIRLYYTKLCSIFYTIPYNWLSNVHPWQSIASNYTKTSANEISSRAANSTLYYQEGNCQV